MNPSARGTVAARVQAFQDVQTLEDLSPQFPNPPIALTQTPERGTITGRGHRKDRSFGTPANRVSRDGTEGVRGDGRPPVGTFNHKMHPSMEEKEDYKLPAYPSAMRPSTGLAARLPDHEDPLLALSKLRSPRRHRSMENVAAPTSEFAVVRSRLRSIAEKKEASEFRPPERALTIAELGDMIDYVKSSLETPGDDEKTELSSEQISGLATPKTSMIRRWRSARASRKSVDASTETQVHHPPLQYDGVAKNRGHPEEYQTESLGRSPPPPQLDVFRHASPVKQRAAMFEKMQTKEDGIPASGPPPDRHIHLKETWKAVPEHEPESEMERALHKLKFGRTVYDRPGSSAATPKFSVGRSEQRQDSSSTSNASSFNTARQSTEKELPKEDGNFPEFVAAEAPSRKASVSWLPPWRLFSKDDSATPQATESNPSAVPGKHTESRPSIVQNRVQHLLSAAHKREQHDYHLKRRPTPYPRRVTESEVKEQTLIPASLQPSQLAAVQVPVQEEAEALQAVEEEQQDASGHYTPVRRSMMEKEVFDSPKQLELKKTSSLPASVRSASPEKRSPTKTAPSTPRRGRALQASISPRGSGYAMEQAFLINPGRSRSQSRASGNRMLVEVEVRDSPGNEAREIGQKIVFVRADVDGIDEEEEG